VTRDTEQDVKPCKFVNGACVNCDATERGDCQGFVYNTHTSRQWVGLTDDDWAKVADMPDTFDQGVAWAQARLKEKNT